MPNRSAFARALPALPLLLLALLAACVDTQADPSRDGAEGTSGTGAAAASPPPIEAIVAAIESMPAEGLWPTFSPAEVPVALFDGERTLLLGHPAPPEEFSPSAAVPGAAVFEGRHPAVRGSMPAEIGGVLVAAVTTEDLAGMSPERAAAVVAHERFHVHQLEHHPGWSANELALFRHPVTDVQQLFDRRLETLALHRAMQATNADRSECWLRTAMLVRRKRMRQLPPAIATYERAIERQEGLARYIERRVARLPATVDIAPNGYAPENVRGRAYVTGEALALMLDRYSPGWRDSVETAEDPPALDSLLWLALATRPETSCGFSASGRAEVLERATAAVESIRAERDSAVRHFMSRPGWSVRVIADAAPLQPQSFDPMNVRRVGPASLLHERMLRASNENGFIDVMDRLALTVGYLDDPIGSGIHEVRVTGFDERPAIASGEDIRVRMVAPGLELSFQNAHVETNDREIVVRVR